MDMNESEFLQLSIYYTLYLSREANFSKAQPTYLFHF